MLHLAVLIASSNQIWRTRLVCAVIFTLLQILRTFYRLWQAKSWLLRKVIRRSSYWSRQRYVIILYSFSFYEISAWCSIVHHLPIISRKNREYRVQIPRVPRRSAQLHLYSIWMPTTMTTHQKIIRIVSRLGRRWIVLSKSWNNVGYVGIRSVVRSTNSVCTSTCPGNSSSAGPSTL